MTLHSRSVCSASRVAIGSVRIHWQNGQRVLLKGIGLMQRQCRLPDCLRLLLARGCDDETAECLQSRRKNRMPQLHLEAVVESLCVRTNYRRLFRDSHAFAASAHVVVKDFDCTQDEFERRARDLSATSEDEQSHAEEIRSFSNWSSAHRRARGRRKRPIMATPFSLGGLLNMSGQIANRLAGKY